MYKKHVLFWCVYTFSYTFNVYTRSYTLFDATYCHLVLTFQLGSWMFLTCYMWIQCFITRCHSYILTKNCPQTKQFGWPMLPCAFFSLLIRLPKLQDNSNQSKQERWKKRKVVFIVYRVLVSFWKRIYRYSLIYIVVCCVRGTHFCLIVFRFFFTLLRVCCGRYMYILGWIQTDVECWTTRSGVTDGSFRLYPTIGHHWGTTRRTASATSRDISHQKRRIEEGKVFL